MKVAAIPLLQRARARVAAGWCRGIARDAAGVEVFPDSDRGAVRYGVDGAIFADKESSSYVKDDALRFLVGAIRGARMLDLCNSLLGPDPDSWDRLANVADWNDFGGTTQADALRLYDRAIALADRLAEALAPMPYVRSARARARRTATERAS